MMAGWWVKGHVLYFFNPYAIPLRNFQFYKFYNEIYLFFQLRAVKPILYILKKTKLTVNSSTRARRSLLRPIL